MDMALVQMIGFLRLIIYFRYDDAKQHYEKILKNDDTNAVN
jgi:hypothetical protein